MEIILYYVFCKGGYGDRFFRMNIMDIIVIWNENYFFVILIYRLNDYYFIVKFV